jgi:Uma2 family endonuclease
MGSTAAEYHDAIQHLPEGATLVIHQAGWEDYEGVLEELAERPHFRVSYDCGRLEIMTPLPEHEAAARFIDDIVRVVAEKLDVQVEKYGSTTWKNRILQKGVEPDACYYVKNAERVIGKRTIEMESDPPPDIAVEIDVTNESLAKFAIYAALRVSEIWRYDGATVHFYELGGDEYREISESRSFAGLTPGIVADALAQSRTEGQSSALRVFRRRWIISSTP